MSAARTRWVRAPFVVFLVLWLAWGAVLGVVRAHHPGPGVGEEWGDADILNAGRWFDREGYGPTGFLPRLDTAPLLPGERAKSYDTFPPGPFWIFQSVKALGIHRLAAQRIVYQVWTHLGELLFFMLVRRLAGSGWIALLAACLHMLSVPYAAYSSGFWVNIGQPTLFAALCAWLRHEDADDRPARRWWLAACAAVTFVDFWITLENGTFIALFVCARALAAPPPRRRLIAAAALVAAVPACVMGLRVLFHTWACGVDLAETVRYFVTSGELRAGLGEGAVTWGEVMRVWITRLGWPVPPGHLASHDQMFLYPVLSPAVLIAAGVLLGGLTTHLGDPRLGAARRGFWSGVLLLLAGATWTVIMRNHVWHHRFTVQTLMPGLALMLASLAWAGVSLRPVRGSASRGKPLAWTPVAGAAVLIIAMVLTLRRSDLLNHSFRLDSERAAQAALMDEVYAVTEQSQRGLRWVDRAVFYPKRPVLGYYLGLPFVQTRVEPATDEPLLLSEHEALLIDTSLAEGGAAAAGLVRRLGLPDVERLPGRLAAFPPARRGVTLDLGASLEGLGRVEQIRVAPTLDRGHVAVIWRLGSEDSRSDLTPDAAGRFIIGFELFDRAGASLGREVAYFWAAGSADGTGGLFWTTVSKPRWKGAATVRFTVWDAPRRALARWSFREQTPLPAGVHPGDGHCWLEGRTADLAPFRAE